MSQAEMTMAGHSGVMEKPAFSVPAKKMAMWLFIIADTATFAGCLVAYGFIRNATPNWPRPFHGVTNVALMTLILLTSSLTMLIGVRSAQKGDKAGAFRWTMITAVAGILFAVLHIREWMGMIGEGGHPFVQFAVFQHYRPASAARNGRCDRSDRSGIALSGGPLQSR